ncbi:hypothetical protein QLX67_14080, partial [Balneolaceae bacterium ANBcel3]|nr:hypothetical protein [Balneolaceae bacterium ANBcel3]
MNYVYMIIPFLLLGCSNAKNTPQQAAPMNASFELNELEYFQNRGVGVMPYLDTSPESRQGGIIIVTHGTRIASNGDLRLEATPGQWSPVPVQQNRVVDRENQSVRTTLSYPDHDQHLRGFNPLYYPDIEFEYDVTVTTNGEEILVRVDLDKPIPDEWVGKIGFNIELYPDDLFGKSWLLDDKAGIFPRHAPGVMVPDDCEPNPEIVPTGDLRIYRPLPNHCGEAKPLATGKSITIAPEVDELRLQIESRNGELELLDGRVQHQNGWFVVRSTVPAGVAEGAIEWSIRPHVIPDWIYEPVMQYSMVGYHPRQQKIAVIETDPNDDFASEV